jgi:MFS family permease
MNFRKVNNISGWVICVIACLVYVLTAEATGSFWDTGEFIASAYKLQNPHPPGAPLFTLIGRFFIILFGGSNPAYAVNVMSAVASGFTILFLFWTVTHFARKLVVGSIAEPDGQQTITIVGAGVVGALAYTFTDSFWFSAVEGEVYALSSFFTALVFWAILKWERADDYAGNDVTARNRADRWIIFIFFTMGLSIGVHLLNLLAIPAIVMVYYFKRYNYTRKGAIIAFLIGCFITVMVQVPVIQWTVSLASTFDRWFVNGFNLPFFSGFIFFFVLIGILTWRGIRYANKNNRPFLRLGLWAFTFLMIGYSTYAVSLIRSNADTALDMNNVDNPVSLVYYLSREQYGEQPLFRGPHYAARPTGYEEGKMRYAKGKDENGKDVYVEIGRSQEPVYDPADIHFFPRVWDASDQQNHARFYAEWLGKGMYRDQNGQVAYEPPTYGDHFQWFFTYQMGFMYWRYFMWNFAGKQNDIQGMGSVRDGNWISGIPMMDNNRLGDQSMMPESIRHNEANNKLFLLPFVLGLAGCVYQFFANRKDWIVTFLLFFLTGLAIVFYLNPPGNQPRERDYAFVGSFYAFSIWIGLAVVAFVRMAKEWNDKKLLINVASYSALASFIILILSDLYTPSMGGVFVSALIGAVYTGAVIAAITFIVQLLGKNNWRTASLTAFAICMLAPVVMAIEEWDDHDRSKKRLAPSMARNYLESLAPNSILFTYGDNDTYPLWYAQEVEGVRPDVRIVNTSLLGIDWYVNQLRYAVNKSAPFDVVFTPQQLQGVGYIQYNPQGPQGKTDLLQAMKNIARQIPLQTFSSKTFSVPVDVAHVKQSIPGATDSVGSEMIIQLAEGKNYLTLDEMTLLSILATNNWKRPIYFTAEYGVTDLGLAPYLRKEGITHRLVPFASNNQRDFVSPVIGEIVSKFGTGGANDPGIYFDEENRRHLLTLRRAYADGAINLASKGDKPAAVALLNKAESLISPANLPYGMVSRTFHNQTSLMYLEAAYAAGHTQLAEKVYQGLKADMLSQRQYYQYLRDEKEKMYDNLAQEDKLNEDMFQYMEQIRTNYTKVQTVQENPGNQPADTTRRNP